MKPLFLCYPKCGTCNKAKKWLAENCVEVDVRDITVENPTVQELTIWYERSGLPINKLFNTSGVKYRELGVKEIIKGATKEELLALLATDGKLVKRPILVAGDTVLIGFNQQEYIDLF
ncbi:MAG: arsenate reductase family protein [Bacteroidales bacterium]